MRELVHDIFRRMSRILPDKSIQQSKREWDALAEENAKYYIVSKKGPAIDEVEFRTIGEGNYRDLILEDPLIKEHIGTFADKRVLDIGCGVGRLMEFFARDFNLVDGVDISQIMVEKGTHRLKHLNNVRFTTGDGEHYPFQDDSFDLVFSYIVFQHMPSVEVIRENFKEIRRVLKPTGIAKIQIRGNQPVRKGTWFYGPSFTAADAQKLMEETGLTVIKMGDASVKRFFLWLKK